MTDRWVAGNPFSMSHFSRIKTRQHNVEHQVRHSRPDRRTAGCACGSRGVRRPRLCSSCSTLSRKSLADLLQAVGRGARSTRRGPRGVCTNVFASGPVRRPQQIFNMGSWDRCANLPHGTARTRTTAKAGSGVGRTNGVLPPCRVVIDRSFTGSDENARHARRRRPCHVDLEICRGTDLRGFGRGIWSIVECLQNASSTCLRKTQTTFSGSPIWRFRTNRQRPLNHPLVGLKHSTTSHTTNRNEQQPVRATRRIRSASPAKRFSWTDTSTIERSSRHHTSRRPVVARSATGDARVCSPSCEFDAIQFVRKNGQQIDRRRYESPVRVT